MKNILIGTMLVSLLALGFVEMVHGEETEVNYKVENSYTLVIPQKIDLQNTTELKLGTSGHNIEPVKQLSITLSSENESISEDGTISLKRQKDLSTNHTLSTKLTKQNDSKVLKKGDLLVKATNKSESGVLEAFMFSEITGDKKAGSYKTTITFVADVTEVIGRK
ncbi:hypothetical protein [Enterococcus sp. DIV0756]|uniref:hypothetical protein n=1 Tax=Enterococcus sp. DIV0756 TaxID=2774636 RepID=UPI003F21923D